MQFAGTSIAVISAYYFEPFNLASSGLWSEKIPSRIETLNFFTPGSTGDCLLKLVILSYTFGFFKATADAFPELRSSTIGEGLTIFFLNALT